MKILDRYLAWAVISGTLLTLGALVPLLGVFLLADEIEGIESLQAGLWSALLSTGLRIPRYAYQIFPLATLIGTLFGLGALASRSELIAMRAAGFSIIRIVRAGILGGVILAIFAFILGEVIAPFAERQSAIIRNPEHPGAITQQTVDGFWAVDAGTYVHLRIIESSSLVREISIYRVDPEQGKLIITHAQEARYQNHHWTLFNITRSSVSAEGVKAEWVPQIAWDSLINPGLLKVVVNDPRSTAVWRLYQYVHFLTRNGQNAGLYAIAFWGKIVHPLLIISMSLIAIPVLLGSSRSSGLGTRIFAGALIGILYYLISRTFASLALWFGLNPGIAAITPLILFMSGALLLLSRINKK